MKLTAPWLNDVAIRQVTGALTAGGHKALFVGGCVRDALLGQTASDFDIATNARPDEVEKLSKNQGLRTIPTGKDHGTITVMAKGKPFEVTTFRKDVETDGRRAVVAFSDNVEDDARRRDFTMNALYAEPDGTIIDPVGGLPDLEARRVVFIDDAEERVREDFLRILRFFRFTAFYGEPENGIDAEGLAACANHVESLSSLSGERIGAEMKKILSAPDPIFAVTSMAASGVLAHVMPGADIRALGPLIALEDRLALDWSRRAAALGGEALGERWRLSKSETRHLERLRELIGAPAGLKEIAYRYGFDTAVDVRILRAAVFETAPDAISAGVLVAAAQAVFPIQSSDLMRHFSGKELGEKLKQSEHSWIKSDFKKSKQELLGEILDS